MKIHDLKLITLVIWGLYTNVINFTLLCLVVFSHFHTFLDGWKGGWVGGCVGGWLGGWGKSILKTVLAQLKLKLGLSLAFILLSYNFCH